ncbi:diguanylate cyclase [Saccharothrix sp. S26]|uniref:putative bifunctional diguanylate cyclase/phosphodiesterase n=1 Tax=Saccharothrix sp. S26 TaxID=2907215 RepID=UPI001F332CE6|nr:diguanylate cyclase [Saccharothrix sp. S26]MCE6999035.1 diguanylate cyclase [Saccharothrix sp. S26]
MSQPAPAPEPRPATPDGARARDLLARKWTYLLSGVAPTALTKDELESALRAQLDALCSALTADRFDAAAVERIGEHVVATGYVGEDGLRRTVDVLGRGLPALPEFRSGHAHRVALGIGALATGFLTANRRAVFEQQERLQLSLLKSVRDAKWHLKESEARFDEVVTSSASGVAIADLDGRLVRTNDAIGDILGRTAEELTGASLFDFVHPYTVGMLREAMRAVVEGRQDRVRQSQRLLRADGDVARISLTASLVGDAGASSHFVVVVEDGTELMLLQNELNRQALHDVLTGLPNRQFFGTHLESAVRRADPVHGLVLLHLDLDAFGLLCDSLGRRAGERLLVHVARRLKSVVAREKAMVARFDGDEFGVLVESTAGTPDIATIVAAVNQELAEPLYVDGRGVAPSASIGVVRGGRDDDPVELLRAADQALRRARTRRRGQWEVFDPVHDLAERSRQELAIGMPGAWERGEITARYRPVVRLADGGAGGVEAVLRWDRPDGPVGHERCVRLAEKTGFVLPLGEWLLGVAGGQVAWWRRNGFTSPLTAALTAHQACDADLVPRVVRALDGCGLAADELVLGFPARVVTTSEAVDNLGVLAEMGVRIAVEDFALGPDDFAAARDVGAHAIRVAARWADLGTGVDAGYAAALTAALRDTGATVSVSGVTTAAQAQWWRRAGAHLATGPFFGADAPAGDFRATPGE